MGLAGGMPAVGSADRSPRVSPLPPLFLAASFLAWDLAFLWASLAVWVVSGEHVDDVSAGGKKATAGDDAGSARVQSEGAGVWRWLRDVLRGRRGRVLALARACLRLAGA